VKVVGRSAAVGQPLLYGTTDRFLMEFGLTDLAELPPLEGADFAHLLRG
jgi:segregation and condensation protein B